MGEAKRRRAAGEDGAGFPEGVTVLSREAFPQRLPPGEIDVLGVEISAKGDMTDQRAREAAEWLFRVAPQKPGAVISATVGGYEDDPREVHDIPEALRVFAVFARRLAQLEMAAGNRRIADRLCETTIGIILHAVGLVKRKDIEIVPLTVERATAEVRENKRRAQEAQARADAEDAAEAARTAARPKN
jgi:hypothetical protein